MLTGFALCRAALAVDGITAPEQSVLTVLAIMANDDGQCWPAINGAAGLTGKTKLSERAVQNATKALETAGHIARVVRPGRGMIYTVHPRTTCTPTPAQDAPPQEMRPAPPAPTPAPPAPKLPRTTITKKATPSPKKRVAAPSFVPPADIPETEWAGFEEMRRRIGKPMTDNARGLAVTRLRKLADDGYPPGAVLNHSILNNYQGLFPPKDDHNGNSTQRRMDGQPDLRGSRPDPALDLLRAARRAEEAERAAGDRSDHWRAGPTLPAIGFR